MAITIESVANLPLLNFGNTREIGTPIEMGQIAYVANDSNKVEFFPEEIIFGIYHDARSRENYLIHSNSLHPHGGFPNATKFSDIHKYKKTRDYQEI